MRPPVPAGSRRALSSPGRIALLVTVSCVWAAHIFLLYSHQIALEKLPNRPADIAPDGVVYQTTNYSCGPASLATIFGHYHILKSEREWADLAGTGIAHGTSLSGLKQAAWSLGFEPVVLNPSFEQLDLVRLPGILFESREYHLVTFWGMDSEGRMIVRDPILGKTTKGGDEYQLDTLFDPTLLVFYPGRVPICDRESSYREIFGFQNMLKGIGYYTGDTDGVWSARLRGAISRFQHDTNLPQTGVVDAATSLYIDGAWRLVNQGPAAPFLAIDRVPDSGSTSHRTTSIVTQFEHGE